MPVISEAQKKYLLHRKHEKLFVRTARVLVFFVFILLWEVSARLGWIDSFIFSSPWQIVRTFTDMCRDHSLPGHIAVTLTETLISFLFVILLGTGTAILLWMAPKVSLILEPYLVVLNSLPKSALAPLLIVWLGANERTIIVAGISVAIFGSIINLYAGFQEIDPEKRKLISTLGGDKKDELFKIVLPASIPLILSNMKVNIGLCLVGVIIGEFIGARKGLGYLIIYGSQTFKHAHIMKQCNVRAPVQSERVLNQRSSEHAPAGHTTKTGKRFSIASLPFFKLILLKSHCLPHLHKPLLLRILRCCPPYSDSLYHQ